MSSPNTRIRPPVRDDGKAILELIRQLGYDVDVNHLLPLLAILMKRDEHHMLVAEVDGQVVGFVNVQVRVFLRYGDLVATVDELVVHEAHRGQGIGAALIEAAIAASSRRGAHHLELTTNHRRTDALRFYQRLGFEITSHKLVYPLSSGVHHESHLPEETHASR